MTNEEAIKQLNSLIENSKSFHEEDGDIWEQDVEALNVAKHALNFIERQQAEIERLKSMNQAKLDTIHDLQEELSTAKAEAIKEFAERLKCRLPQMPD